MKQGRAGRDVSESYHVDPKSRGVNPGGVNILGNHVGDHVTASPQGTKYTGEPLYRGRGFEAPRNKSQSHGSGSQGRY
jgi:hypothetical protein